jgi:hypothetical protein
VFDFDVMMDIGRIGGGSPGHVPSTARVGSVTAQTAPVVCTA